MRILKNIKPLYILIALIVIHLLFLSKVFFFPYPELFIYSYLTEQGLVPYKEILDQHFPGIMFFPVNLASLGLANIYSTRVLHLSLVGITQVLIFFAGKKLLKNGRLALIGNVLYLVWQPFFEGNVFWIDSFIPVFLLTSYYLLISSESESKNPFFAGFFIGVALLFKQTVAPLLILLLIYLFIKRSLYKLRFFILGALVPALCLMVWVSIQGIWNEFVYWTFTFNVTTFAQMGRKYPTFVGLAKASPMFALPFISFLLVKKNELSNKKYLIPFIFFIGSLAFAYARFDYIHLQPALPFAILLTLNLLDAIPKRYYIIFSALYISVLLFLLNPYYKSIWGQKVLFFGKYERDISKSVLSYAERGDTIFSLGASPHIYYLTKTIPPGRIFVFQFPWFMKVAEDRVLSGIINDPPLVVIRDENAKTGGMSLIKYMQNIDAHITANYEVIEKINDVEVMIPK